MNTNNAGDIVWKVICLVGILLTYVHIHLNSAQITAARYTIQEQGAAISLLKSKLKKFELEQGGGSGPKQTPSAKRIANIREGAPNALPALPVSDTVGQKLQEHRNALGYGGANEGMHIGGFLQNDTKSYERNLWHWLIFSQKVTSMLDVGCGMGYSSKYFLDHGVDVLCVEGSHEGVETTVLPKSRVVEHDFTRGPWWPKDQVFDIVWSVEFLEHIDQKYLDNVVAAFKSARYLFVSHSTWGGWHHVSVHKSWWWVEKLSAYGFEYSEKLTEISKNLCKGRPEQSYFGMHGLVFRNPELATEDVFKEPGTMEERKLVWERDLYLHQCHCF